MAYFQHHDTNLYYEENGSGRPLIFLHGAALDMHQWEMQVEYFSKQYRIITLDARGHGKSTLPHGKVSPDIFWQDVYQLMKYLELDNAIICGLSFGGHTAIQTAINAPEMVKGLILIGTPCTNQFNLYERITVPINRLSLKFMPMKAIAMCLGIYLGKYNQKTKDYIIKTVSRLNHDEFNRVWEAITNMESRKGLSKITCPTLILIGEHDFMTKRQQDFIHKSICGSQLVTIANAHHGTNLDNPTQVQQEIEKFLQKI